MDQFFVETATWGLDLWEQQVGIETDRGLSHESRRAEIKQKLVASGQTTVEMVRQLAEAITGYEARVTVAETAEQLIRSSDLVVFATVAARPHVADLAWVHHDPLVLHVSLRDLAPEAILAHHNVVDDLHHVNRAQTSIHLASELAGNTDFVHGSLGEILLGRVEPPPHDGRLVIFSPFGLGTLDLAVADLVQRVAGGRGEGVRIPSFFPP